MKKTLQSQSESDFSAIWLNVMPSLPMIFEATIAISELFAPLQMLSTEWGEYE